MRAAEAGWAPGEKAANGVNGVVAPGAALFCVVSGSVKGTWAAGELDGRSGDLPMDGKRRDPPDGKREATGASSRVGCGVNMSTRLPRVHAAALRMHALPVGCTTADV